MIIYDWMVQGVATNSYFSDSSFIFFCLISLIFHTKYVNLSFKHCFNWKLQMSRCSEKNFLAKKMGLIVRFWYLAIMHPHVSLNVQPQCSLFSRYLRYSDIFRFWFGRLRLGMPTSWWILSGPIRALEHHLHQHSDRPRSLCKREYKTIQTNNKVEWLDKIYELQSFNFSPYTHARVTQICY